MQKLHAHYSTKQTPQSEPIPGKDMVPNSAGGFSFAVDDWKRLDRFLILGSDSPSYYATAKELTRKNAEAVERLLKQDGERVVARIAEISDAGRAPNNDPALFALAMASALGDLQTRRAALNALQKVARIGTHLLHFAEYRQAFGGWGRQMRRAVSSWYTDKDVDDLAYQLVKYQQRDGWSHRDLLRLSHPRPTSPEQNALLAWAVGRDLEKPAPEGHQRDAVGRLPQVITAFEELKALINDPKAASRVIRDNKLPREAVPTELLGEVRIWDALLPHMPMTAMIRNLGTMTKSGLLKPMNDASKTVIAQLSDKERIRKARVHPLQVLIALKTYAQGHGMRSDASWEPVTQIVDALDDAFYAAFENVEPTGKRLLLAVDVSGSMSMGNVAGSPLTPREAAAAMAMVTARVESNYQILGFSHTLVDIPISKKDRLDKVASTMGCIPMGGTDCALPMIYARERGIRVDGFVVYTDSETWHGGIHPIQALEEYRRTQNIPAKLAVVAFVADPFSIADPNDSGMMDFVGFDASGPAILSDFIKS